MKFASTPFVTPRVLRNEPTQRELERQRMHQVTMHTRGLDIVTDDHLEAHLAIGSVDQVVTKFGRRHQRDVFVLRNRADILVGQVRQGDAVFKRKHASFLRFHSFLHATPAALRSRTAPRTSGGPLRVLEFSLVVRISLARHRPMIQLSVNGLARSVPEGANLSLLLDELSLTGKRVAVERNGEIVPRSRHAQTPLADGDTLEIVVAVGGG